MLGLVIDREAPSVLAGDERLAVVGGDDDERVVQDALCFESIQHLIDQAVDVLGLEHEPLRVDRDQRGFVRPDLGGLVEARCGCLPPLYAWPSESRAYGVWGNSTCRNHRPGDCRASIDAMKLWKRAT